MDGGADIQSDSEIYFTGKMDSDMGIQFGVRVQLEANNGSSGATSIDESNAWVSGDFGRIEFGARDPIHTRMHYAAAFGAGVGLNAGDTQKWIPGAYLETAGWTIPGDDPTLSYISPRVSGIQVGVSYTADSTGENSVTSAPTDNDNAAWAAAINFNQTVGDMSVKASLGTITVSNPGSVSYDHDGDALTPDAVNPRSPTPSSTASSTTPTASTSPASHSASATGRRRSTVGTTSEKARPGGRVQGRLRRRSRPQHRASAPACRLEGLAGAQDTPLHDKQGSLTLAPGWPPASPLKPPTQAPAQRHGRDRNRHRSGRQMARNRGQIK